MRSLRRLFSALLVLSLIGTGSAYAACVDNVVLVHGNTGKPTDFQATHDLLVQRGYTESQIFAPAWGNAFCAACNDHKGTEETPVENAIVDALASSCTGKIDVIGHSMGATLAARVIDRIGASTSVDAFIGIAGAFRGLWSCGTYPFNVATTTCGSWGLSVNNPFLNGISGHKFGARMYSFKSYADEINCYGGVCLVYGVHTSQIAGETASYTFPYGHYGLLWYTATQQVNLL
ncbi:lipase (class 2) [Luteibacter rhizovicinus]|uniref:Lipase (Class 2) n=1 Tax=Luteibacter rhizovicinus TaxID=242606 RepID=A0A4R3YPB9_9GAMM|nr:alpha/beta fold hydrolase [Luteibacter rhizovicinus]TCV94587.1 lipase (class 2) [Luteibacter rhizovicinus]